MYFNVLCLHSHSHTHVNIYIYMYTYLCIYLHTYSCTQNTQSDTHTTPKAGREHPKASRAQWLRLSSICDVAMESFPVSSTAGYSADLTRRRYLGVTLSIKRKFSSVVLCLVSRWDYIVCLCLFVSCCVCVCCHVCLCCLYVVRYVGMLFVCVMLVICI